MRNVLDAQFVRMIRRTAWYRQGGAMTMWYGSIPWSALADSTIFGKRAPVQLIGAIGYHRRALFIFYWPIAIMRKGSAYYVKRQCANPSFIRRLHESWTRTAHTALQEESRRIKGTSFSPLTNRELERRFMSFIKIFRHPWREAIFHDVFDYTANDLVRTELLERTSKLSTGEIETLLAPTVPIVMQRERASLAYIAAEASRDRRLRRFVVARSWNNIRSLYPQWHKRLRTHRDEWKWMMNDFEFVIDRPVTWFAERVRHYLMNTAELKCDLSIPASVRKLADAKRALIRKKRLTRRQRAIAELLSTVQVWRDERKAMTQAGNVTMRQFLEEVSRRTKIHPRLLHNAFWWEIGKALRASPQFKKILRLRTLGLIHRTETATTHTLMNGPRSARYNRLLGDTLRSDDLHGMSAFAGIVRGKARYVLTQSDFPNFRSGEILIAPNTRPEYVTIMKKAGAIVTEEGGITSHAAIVSRELKIPAVVGVQGVLEAFKNGDRIEVDAERGIVRKLSLPARSPAPGRARLGTGTRAIKGTVRKVA